MKYYSQLQLVLLVMLLFSPATILAKPEILLARTGLTAEDLAVIINDDDAQSREVGEYYQKARHIPAANVIHLHFPPGSDAIGKDEFQKLKSEIDFATPAHIQAYAVTWTKPFRVGCMSVTSALAFGYDAKYCSLICGATQASAYFNANSLHPFKDFRIRPSMMLAGESFKQVKLLIDRGVASDYSYPAGRAYLLNTQDTIRSVRAADFAETKKQLKGVFKIEVLKANAISDRKDVLFYFTGLTKVPLLETLHFQPGALADHLTSLGGQLTDSSQMSILRWLEAGATASYGTVVEPCNHPQKFPLPGIAMFFYAKGESAIEAYWKSVAWPGEGVFVGEPLARPFAPLLRKISADNFELKMYMPREGLLRVESAASGASVFNPVAQQELHRGLNIQQFAVPEASNGFFRLSW